MQVLSDAQWANFEAAIEAAEIRGARPRREDRRTIEAIIWRLDNGAKWRSIPAELGDWHHAYLRFQYEAARARRQYDAVDPDNRLVAGELELRWNEKLFQLRDLEIQRESLDQAKPAPTLAAAD